ncbi:MAG: MBL fold metallo-hydrolase [Saprospiraceae bacterium]|nr:MBL fold metallo-hydrolase [Saprospiraceae bacterium]MBK7809777.1 MBL fold metallo-hydrolase [Saprospiraceae bacterium]MBK9632112.1 MBL fold metallo-hydrolase [Saprospiraceae bacterium]
MEIKQFEDKNLAHYSYAIVSHGEMALIDPARNPQPYYDFAKQHKAKITAVIETHPHADFVSSHTEIHNTTDATIYVSKLLGAEYEHQTFDEGDAIVLGKITLKALNTPGHSPDSISIVAIDENGKENAVFTGDTLFIGDCGRPDLREQAGAITATREELAKQMFHSLRNKLMTLPDDVLIYPAHGAGSLCGKGLRDQNSSTIGAEKTSNWSLQNLSEEEFVKELLADQPFIPKYFPFDVGINKKGADAYATSILKVPQRETVTTEEFANSLNPNILIIDTRPQEQFKKAYLKNAINLMNDTKFETWLGSIVNPDEQFYLIAENEMVLNQLIERTAKIGYEKQIALALVIDYGNMEMNLFDSDNLKDNEDAFTIVDIRNHSEVKNKKIFTNAIHIPLHELRERTNEIPFHKPIIVHCAGGYRSAAGSSIIKSKLNGTSQVYDLSEAVKHFQK